MKQDFSIATSGQPDWESAATAWVVAAIDCIRRVAGPNSAYAQQSETYLTHPNRPSIPGRAVSPVYELIRSLRSDIDAGLLVSFEQTTRAETYGDMLDSASRLLDEDEPGYKAAATVLAGSILEEHLRKLCESNGIETTYPDRGGTMRQKTADRMNNDLAGASVYSKGDQTLILGWIHFRNDAAHARHENLHTETIANMVRSIRTIIQQYPA